MTRSLPCMVLALLAAGCVDVEPKGTSWPLDDPNADERPVGYVDPVATPTPVEQTPNPDDGLSTCMSVDAVDRIEDVGWGAAFFATNSGVIFHRRAEDYNLEVHAWSYGAESEVAAPGWALGAQGSRVLVATYEGVELIDRNSGSVFQHQDSMWELWPEPSGESRKALDGDLAAWQGGGGKWLSLGADAPRRLADAAYRAPYVADGMAVWVDRDPSSYAQHVYGWKDGQTERLTATGSEATMPVTSAGRVFWLGERGAVWMWDSGQSEKLHDGPCGPVATDRGEAVFACADEGYGGTYAYAGARHLYHFDGARLRLVHEAEGDIFGPRLQTGVIAWAEFEDFGQMSPGTVYIQRAADGTTVEVGPMSSGCIACCGPDQAVATLEFVDSTLAWTQSVSDEDPWNVGIAVAYIGRRCPGGS